MFNHLRQEVDEIAKQCDDDFFHSLKRRKSFDLLDGYLDLCCQGKCPDIKEIDIYHLVDISIEGYIKDRAYYYTVPKDQIIGKDDNDRYYMAWNKLRKVYNCSCLATIDRSIFLADTNEVEVIFREQARKRKAYWSYLSNAASDHVCNYCKSCEFVEKQKEKESNPDAYRQLILENQNKANAIDLFRLCHIRRNCAASLNKK